MTTQARECGAKPRREEQPSSNAATTAAAATTPNHKTAAATATTDADTQRAVLPRSPTQRRQTRAILYRLARPPRPLPRPRNVDASASTHNDDTRGASDDRTRRPQYGACVDLLFHATSPLRRHHRDANDDNDDDDDDSRCCCFDNEPYQHDSALVPVSFYEEMARHIATDTTDTRNTTTTTADVVAVRPMSILPLTRTPTTNNNNDNNNDDNNNSCSSSDIAPSGAELRSPIFIRRVDAVPPIAMAQPLPCGTDVNMPTSNYLQLDASHNTHQHAPGFRRCEAAALRTLLDTAARDLERHGGATTASTSANNDNNNNNNNNNDEANVTVLTTRDALHSVFAHACARRHEQPLLLLRVQRTGPVLSIDCHRDAATIVTTTTTTTAADDDDAAAAREADEHGTLPSATTTTAAVTATTTTTTTTTMHTTRHASVRALRDKALLSKVLYRHVEAAQAATTTKITTTTCTVGDDSNEDDDEATRATSSRSPQLPPQRITPSLSQQHGALYDRYSQVLRLDTGRRVVYVGVDAPLVYNARDGTEQLLALRDTTRRQQHRRNHNDNSISNTHDDDDDDDDEDERRDALRCWFDATLTHTPQVGIYEHSAGVVERYEVARVRALLRQHEWQAATAALQVLLNVLEWLVRHCVRDAGTYVVVGGGGGGSSDGDDDDSSSSSLELYELPHSVHATTPTTMSSCSSSGERRHEARDEHAAAAAAEAAAQRRREQEELHVQLARMCYGMARHMLLQSPPPQQQTRAHAAGTLHNNNSNNKDDADVRVAHDAHTLLLRSFMVFVQHTDDPLHRVALRDLTQLLPLLIHRWLRGARADAHASLLAAHASAQRMLQRMLARLQHALRDGGGRTTAATRAVLHSCCASCATALLTLAAHALYACEDAHEQQQQQQHSDELAAEAVAATTTDVMSTLLLACVDDVARLQRLLAYLQRRLGVSLSQQQQPQPPSDSDTSTSTRGDTTTSTRNANADDNNTRNATTASRQLVERSVCDVSLSPLCVALHELCGDAVCFAMTSNTAVQLLRDSAASVLQAQRKDDDDNDDNNNDDDDNDDDAVVTALLRRLSTLPDDVTALSFAALRFYAAAASVVVGSDSNSNSDAVVAAALRARRLAHVHFRVATAYHRAQRHTKALEALHSCKQQLQLALLSSSPPAALNNNNNNNNSTKKSSDGDDAAVVTSLSRAARLTRTDVARAVAAVYVDMLAAKAEQLTTPVAVALSPATVTTTTTTATATTTTKAVSVLSCQPLLIGAVYDVRDELERLLHSALDAYAECADDRHATDNNNNNSSRVHAQHQQRHDDDGRRACDGDAMTCARVELLLLRVHAHLHRLAAAATPCDRATCSRLLAYVREAQRLAPPSARWRGGCEWLLMRLYTATSPHATSAELHKSATTTLHRWCVAAMHDGVLHDDDDNEDDKSSNKVDDEDGGGGAADDDAVVSCLRCSQHDMIRQLQRGPATRVEWHLQLALVCCVAAERLCSSSSNNSSSGSHSKHHYYECQQWVRRASTLVNAAIDAFVDASARTQMTTAKTTTLQAAARSWHVSTPAMWLYRMASMVLLRTLTATRDGLASKQRRAAAAVMQTLLSLERDLHTTTATNDATTGALTSLQRALQPLLSW